MNARTSAGARQSHSAERAQRARSKLAARAKRYPLAYARLWDNPAPQTSQRRALLPLLDPGVLLLSILGGNRTGKSLLMAMWLVACALGRDFCVIDGTRKVYPVLQWLDLNGLPHRLIPEGPGEVWCASPNFGVARAQIRKLIRRFCPEGSRFIGWDNPAEARIEFPNGGEIVSKAYKQYDQDPQTWEGSSVRAIGLDEQPTTLACLKACFFRILDQRKHGAWVVNALTPLRGKRDWYYTDIAGPKALAAEPDYRVSKLKGSDNPHVDAEERARILRKASSWERAAREDGDFVDPEGQVYPLSQEAHILQPFVPPTPWLRLAGVDWGARSPHVLWAALVSAPFKTTCGHHLERGDLVVYRELAPRKTVQEAAVTDGDLIAAALKLEEGTPEGLGHAEIYRVADSENPGAILEASRVGFHAAAAKKGAGSIARGIGLVESRLQLEDPLLKAKDGTPLPKRPTLYFTQDCAITIDEMVGLRWAEEREGIEPTPDRACPDHGPDVVRYITEYVEEMRFAA